VVEETWWIIVGGAKRLGLELAGQLSEKHNLVITSSRAPKEGDKLSGPPDSANIRRLYWDANDPHLASRMMTDIEALKGEGIYLSGAIIIAGTFPLAPIGSWDVIGLQQTWQLNLTFQFLAAQSLAPHLKEGSCIQFILDTCLHRPMLKRLPYSAAKTGLACLVNGLARLLAPNIRIVGHAIGTMLPDEESDPVFLQSQTLLKRLGSPEELRKAVDYAASSPFLTGEILTLDGGWRWA